MNWYIYAVTAAVFYAAQMLGLRRLQKTHPIPEYMAYVWLGSGALIGLLFVRSTNGMTPTTLLLVLGAAFGSWAGMYGVNKAMSLQPNVGYVDAVGTLRLGLVYGVSIFFFGAPFEPMKLVLVAGTVVGVALIIGRSNSPLTKIGGYRKSGESDRTWVAWLLLSVLCFTLLFVCIRMATGRGMDALAATALVMVLASGMYAAMVWRGGMVLRPSRDWPMILLVIVLSTIGNIAFFSSLTSAPNLAYTDAIVNLRIVILYLAALLMGAGRLQAGKALGVAVACGCAVLLG